MTDEKTLIPERGECGAAPLDTLLSGFTFAQEAKTVTCPDHGDYEAAVMTIGGREIVSYCPACAEVSKARQIDGAMAELREHREKARRRRVEARVATSGIPPRFRDCSFDSFEIATGTPAEASQARAVKVCRAFVDRWESVRAKGQVLVMTGPTGTGKTHLACAIANAVMYRHEASVAFGTVSDHVRGVKAAFQKESGRSERDAVNALIDLDLLILDEIGQRTTDYDQQLMFDVINSRYNHMRPMVLMSNLLADDLEQVLGDRLSDRLREIGMFLPMSWESHRSRKR